jgi:hypothetical protein
MSQFGVPFKEILQHEIIDKEEEQLLQLKDKNQELLRLDLEKKNYFKVLLEIWLKSEEKKKWDDLNIRKMKKLKPIPEKPKVNRSKNHKINGIGIFTPKRNPLDEMTREELEASLHLDIEKKEEESIEKVLCHYSLVSSWKQRKLSTKNVKC